MVLELANGLRDRGSITGLVIPKTQKMLSDDSLLNTQHYEVRTKSKRSNPEKGIALSRHLGVWAIEKEAFGSPSTTISQFIYLFDP